MYNTGHQTWVEFFNARGIRDACRSTRRKCNKIIYVKMREELEEEKL